MKQTQETNKGLLIKLRPDGRMVLSMMFHETEGSIVDNYDEVMREIDPEGHAVTETPDRVNKCLLSIENALGIPNRKVRRRGKKKELKFFMWLMGVIMLNSPEGRNSDLKSWLIVYDDESTHVQYMNASALDFAYQVAETGTAPFTFDSFVSYTGVLQ